MLEKGAPGGNRAQGTADRGVNTTATHGGLQIAAEARPLPKKYRVLGLLFAGRRIDRFDAAREVRDHVLHSTIAEIQRHGLAVARELVTLPALNGSASVTCARYWLTEESRALARDILERKGALG